MTMSILQRICSAIKMVSRVVMNASISLQLPFPLARVDCGGDFVNPSANFTQRFRAEVRAIDELK